MTKFNKVCYRCGYDGGGGADKFELLREIAEDLLRGKTKPEEVCKFNKCLEKALELGITRTEDIQYQVGNVQTCLIFNKDKNDQTKALVKLLEIFGYEKTSKKYSEECNGGSIAGQESHIS